MTLRVRLILGLLVVVGVVFLFTMLAGNGTVSLFEPRGVIAMAERDVIIKTVLIMLGLAIPMLIALFVVVWKFRASNSKATYNPKLFAKGWNQLALWVLPTAIVLGLWGITWNSAHNLDPYKSLHADAKPITIQVIALQWKWLFIYPEQGIATVNQIEFPVNTPVHFELSADGPMSSFWIPQLGSQMYAMEGMQTQLNLMASQPGDYLGKDTEINGEGYAGMTFNAKAVSQTDFDAWVQQARLSSQILDATTYKELAKPSMNNAPVVYASAEPGLFENLLMKDMNNADMRGMHMPGM